MSVDKLYRPVIAPSLRLGTSRNREFVTAVQLTAAQIIAMFTTPVPIIPAPLSTDVIVVDSIILIMTRTSTAFTGGGTVNLQYHTTTSSIPHAGTCPASVVTGGAGVVQQLLGPAGGTNGLVLPAGEGIDITNGSGVFAAGTGTMLVIVKYTIVNIGG